MRHAAGRSRRGRIAAQSALPLSARRPPPGRGDTVKDTAIEALGVSRIFTQGGGLFGAKRTLHAVRDVSLAIRTGEAVAIVGESGSGKTTLGNLLTGLDTPTAGEVRLGGKRVQDLPRLERAKHV